METRYTRNRIYLTEEEQKVIKECPILLAGCGIGSVIAECALRMGFEKLTIVDGDLVEESNLNRQNYTEHDVFIKKAEAIKRRLLSINQDAQIEVHDCYIEQANIFEIIRGHEIAINALDFSSDIPLVFDRMCQQENVHILHPYNLGWGGLVTVIAPNGISLSTLQKPGDEFNELNFVEYASGYLKFWGNPHPWIDEIVQTYKEEPFQIPPPQLSIGSWSLASICTHILYLVCTGKEFKRFPDFYFSSIMES